MHGMYKSNPPAYVVLENVRSAQNVGAIFRTSEAIGVSKIYLVGYTPTPVDRFGREVGKLAKAALGAHKMVAWEHSETIAKLVKKLQHEQVRIVAVERHATSVDYKTIVHDKATAYIFGNEIDGVSAMAQQASALVVALPMRGRKESLNVATTVGICLYRFLD
jgi:23S rRNA (guanosine2251-2'-O)-methyltransferase